MTEEEKLLCNKKFIYENRAFPVPESYEVEYPIKIDADNQTTNVFYSNDLYIKDALDVSEKGWWGLKLTINFRNQCNSSVDSEILPDYFYVNGYLFENSSEDNAQKIIKDQLFPITFICACEKVIDDAGTEDDNYKKIKEKFEKTCDFSINIFATNHLVKEWFSICSDRRLCKPDGVRRYQCESYEIYEGIELEQITSVNKEKFINETNVDIEIVGYKVNGPICGSQLDEYELPYPEIAYVCDKLELGLDDEGCQLVHEMEWFYEVEFILKSNNNNLGVKLCELIGNAKLQRTDTDEVIYSFNSKHQWQSYALRKKDNYYVLKIGLLIEPKDFNEDTLYEDLKNDPFEKVLKEKFSKEILFDGEMLFFNKFGYSKVRIVGDMLFDGEQHFTNNIKVEVIEKDIVSDGVTGFNKYYGYMDYNDEF